MLTADVEVEHRNVFNV